MAIPWRTTDSYAGIHQCLARGIDIVYGVGEVAEIAALVVFFRVPVVSKLNLRLFIVLCCQEYQAKPSLLEVAALQLLETQVLAIELQRLIKVLYSNHCVKVFHRDYSVSVCKWVVRASI